MSRAYRISVTETLRRHIRVDDGVQAKLTLLGVLPGDRMAALLAAELEAAGFERADDGTLARVEDDGTVVSVDPATATVTVRGEADADFEDTAHVTRRVEEEVLDAGRKRAAQDAKRVLEARAEAAEDALKDELAKRLSDRLRDLHVELDRVSNRTMAAALKERAQQMGEIKEVSEDPETGALTIRVKV